MLKWSSCVLIIWWEQRTHWKSPWFWERLRAEGEEGIRGWDNWMASSTQWTWTWANSRISWGTGIPVVLQSMRSQRVGHDWATELNHSTPGLPVHHQLPKLMSIESVMPSSHLILWCPLLLLPLISSSIRDFSNESALCINDQNTGVSASASVLAMSIQGWSPLRLTGLIYLLSKELSAP